MKTNKKAKAYSYIRFSKPSQAKGGSEKRQTQKTNPQSIARELGLDFDEELKLIDRGLSGYTGEHRTKGALGQFLKLIDQGSIVPGSVLIIEELDRLTREAILEAVHLMTGILLKDIGIYTVMDEQLYTKQNYDLGMLIISAYKLQTGNQESYKKSVRGLDTWEQKREEARNGGKKLTSISPAWLRPIKDESGCTVDYEIIEEVKQAVNLIFELKLKGYGNLRIAKKLNDDINVWKPEKSNRNEKGVWAESTIQRYVGDIRVLGNQQHHTKKDGKRIPKGDVNKGYYKQIVSDELFYAVQNRIDGYKNKKKHLGGNTPKVNNVFSHIAKCGYCGGSMHFDDKGDSSKGGQYLRCYTSRRGLKNESGKRICEARSIPYEHFFSAFFEYIDEVDVEELLQRPDEIQNEIKENELSIEANKKQIKNAKEEEINIREAIRKTSNEKVQNLLLDDLDSLIKEKEELDKLSKNLVKQQQTLKTESKNLTETISNAQAARDFLDLPLTEQESIEARIKLRGLIRNLVTQIEIYPLTEKFVQLKEMEGEPGVYIRMKSRYIDRFRVHFKKTHKHKAIVWLKRTIDTEGLV